jgi:glycosyltransferase involved in cell wall biosynthesis
MSLAELSVIIPCYRCADTIERAVASVDAQTLRPAELILVDDCSGDDTLETLRVIQQAYGEKWIKIISPDENKGCGGARNIGWSIATQPYVAFLDADDVWVPHKVEIQFNWMRNHPDVLYTGHPVSVLADNSAQPPDITGQPDFKRMHGSRLLLSNNQVAASSIMAKRDMPYRYAAGRRRTEDYLLSCQICLDGHSIYRCTEKLAAFYKAPFGAGGLSEDLWLMEKSELSVYRDLHREKRLNLLGMLFTQAWSLLRYTRRIAIVHIFRSKRKK